MNLTNKTIILTGASQGIGRAAAYKFVEAGCNVALVARSKNLLDQLTAELGTSKVLAIPADVSRLDDCAHIVESTVNHFGQIDILVNNAAVGIYGPGETMSLDELNAVMQINFFGPLTLARACIPPMRANGGGLIVNVSSIIGRRATPWAGGYCASKAALERIVESMRVELAPDNIRFSTLYPGVTQSNFTQNSLGNAKSAQGRIQGIPAEKAAAKLVQVAQKEPRDAYVTLFDRLFVAGSRLLPGVVDWAFQRYFVTTHPPPTLPPKSRGGF